MSSSILASVLPALLWPPAAAFERCPLLLERFFKSFATSSAADEDPAVPLVFVLLREIQFPNRWEGGVVSSMVVVSLEREQRAQSSFYCLVLAGDTDVEKSDLG
jgi:hypothetical protein